MKRILHNIPLAVIPTVIAGCSSARKLPVTINKSDSVCIETRYVKYTVKDTVYLEIPAQAAERTTRDSLSHLENDYAVSEARINADGTLYHDLSTKPHKRPVETERQVERKDSIVYRDREVEVPVQVERKLSWWQHTCITWFPYSLAAIAGLAYIIMWFLKKSRVK